MAIALHHSKAKGSAKLILVGIANHDGDAGAMVGMPRLATYGGVDVRQARKLVRRLEALGEIRTHVQAGTLSYLDDHEQPNRYDFLLACPVWCDRSKQHRDTRKSYARPVDPSATQPLWITPRSPGTPPVLQDRGAPVPQNPLTVPRTPATPGSGSTTGHARPPTPPCVECSAPDLDTCVARQAKVAKADRHPYQPRPPRPREDPTP
jgi:hypothetical protein